MTQYVDSLGDKEMAKPREREFRDPTPPSTAILLFLDSLVGTPTALQTAIEEQATKLAAELSDDGVTVTDAEAKRWLETLLSNSQARRCLTELKSALDEFVPILTELRPLLEL